MNQSEDRQKETKSRRAARTPSYAEGARPRFLRAGLEFGFSLVDQHRKQVGSE
jgi:hypothetical protein